MLRAYGKHYKKVSVSRATYEDRLKVTSSGLKKLKVEYDSCRLAELEARSAFEQARNQEEVRAKLGIVRGELEEARGQIKELRVQIQDQEGRLGEMT